MLDARGIDYAYREYRKDPLSAGQIRSLLARLGMTASALLRVRDAAARELGLTGDEPEDELIDHMASHPPLIQRPIGVKGDRAVLGRPPEALLEL